ncbi:MAG: acyltransferase [Candidatus Electrothrix aestuarii]|uniref:Acyltransferase n=1 Tax=Candidatus Electrothrix aestuarii TaxID=3062594 RepID=A0AAU8LTH1_9BACT|nr:acyltransferase [Candidatus Electrothrix aestuarii]
MKKTHNAITGKGSSLSKYQDVMVGTRSLYAFLYYEWCQFLAPIPGALGMVLRKIFWPALFGSCGKGCMFAAGITLRQPGRIHLGDAVILSEGCILDGRHGTESVSIRFGNNVMLSNDVMISCKNGTISIGDNCGINARTIVQSTNNCPVHIGSDCIIGQQCFLVGGGSYNIDRLDIPMREQGIRADGGIHLEEDVWLGGKVTVLGGVTMGKGSVAGAGAILTRSVDAYTISVGAPARVVKNRKDTTA